jgi:hypothetical protein
MGGWERNDVKVTRDKQGDLASVSPQGDSETSRSQSPYRSDEAA